MYTNVYVLNNTTHQNVNFSWISKLNVHSNWINRNKYANNSIGINKIKQQQEHEKNMKISDNPIKKLQSSIYYIWDTHTHIQKIPWDFEKDFQKVIWTSLKIQKLSKALFIHSITRRKLLLLLFISNILETHQIQWISRNVSKNALTLTRTHNPRKGHNYYLWKQENKHRYLHRPAVGQLFIISHTHRIQRIRNHKLRIDLDAACRNWLFKFKVPDPRQLMLYAHTHTYTSHACTHSNTKKASFIPHDCQNCVYLWVEYVIALYILLVGRFVCLLVCLRICCWFSALYFFCSLFSNTSYAFSALLLFFLILFWFVFFGNSSTSNMLTAFYLI